MGLDWSTEAVTVIVELRGGDFFWNSNSATHYLILFEGLGLRDC